VDFSTGKPQPPRTTPVGQETRNWLWKRVNLAKESLALNTNCQEKENSSRGEVRKIDQALIQR
jgi:hypothetical protein